MAKVMDWITANKLSLNISKRKYMLITNKHVNTESFEVNTNFIIIKEHQFTSTLP